MPSPRVGTPTPLPHGFVSGPDGSRVCRRCESKISAVDPSREKVRDQFVVANNWQRYIQRKLFCKNIHLADTSEIFSANLVCGFAHLARPTDNCRPSLMCRDLKLLRFVTRPPTISWKTTAHQSCGPSRIWSRTQPRSLDAPCAIRNIRAAPVSAPRRWRYRATLRKSRRPLLPRA